MNRKTRKARKMFLRRYGRSTHPAWQRQPQQTACLDELESAMQTCMSQATGKSSPQLILSPDVARAYARAIYLDR